MPGDHQTINVNEEICAQTGTSQEDKKPQEHETENWGKLQKVPDQIMGKNEIITKYFKPREISVGPIHAGDSNLSKRELKVQLAKKFIEDSNGSEERFRRKIKNKIQFLRKFFGKGIADSYTDDDLTYLLFLDGCAVLQFIYSWNSENLKEFNISSIQATLIQQDLFLFENQIPFQVLRLLMTELSDEKEKEEFYPDKGTPFSYAIVNFVYVNNICSGEELDTFVVDHYKKLVGVLDKKKPDHLLDLLRIVCVEGSLDKDIDKEDYLSLMQPILNMSKNDLPDVSKSQINKLFEPLIKLLVKQRRSFRNVQDLKLSGIKMKRSKSHSLKSVSFSTHCFGFTGQLELPMLIVNNSTVSKLLNLVAYETCLDVDTKRRVSSYLHFLDLLIDTEQDASDLRAANILWNRLSSDAEVAQLFNVIGLNELISTTQDYFYAWVTFQIQLHYKKKFAIWLAQVYNSHFKNPVTVMALLAATAALVLSFLQTWYAIHH